MNATELHVCRVRTCGEFRLFRESIPRGGMSKERNCHVERSETSRSARCGKFLGRIKNGDDLKGANRLRQAITEIANAMPLARTAQLYEFAVFLQSHPLLTEETFEEIARDEDLWDAQFAATTDRQWDALVAMAEKEIAAGETTPMFDGHGNWIEHK